MNIMNYFKKKTHQHVKTIVFPEGENASVIKAAITLKKENSITPILIGDRDNIIQTLDEAYDWVERIKIINPTQDTKLSHYINLYCQERQMPIVVGKKIITQPIYFAAMMVKTGDADGMVAGIHHPTNEIIVASELIFGLQEEIRVPSSFYLVDVPGFKGEEESLMVFSDPAINPDPTAQELADIAYITAYNVEKLLDWKPRVALLSFSTKGSAGHPCVDKVQKAMEILKQKETRFIFDGELQADAAINKAIGYKKTKGLSEVAGRANVLIFPNLDACNISSKLVQQFTGAKFYGPILQGFNFPVSDLSRGATIDDIIGTALLTAARC